jgi:hypothetical protein
MIVSIEPSPLKNKRFRITMDNRKSYDFGLKGGSTYIDHHDKQKRDAYRKRHYANATEKKLIDNLVPSASLFAYYILWGDSTDINTNIKKLNSMWSRGLRPPTTPQKEKDLKK